MTQKTEHIGVVVIVVNENGNVLLGKRITSYGAGFFGLPGGRAHMGEKLSDAVVRELLEETGLTTESADTIGVVRENQESYSFVHFGFIVTETFGKLENKEPEKCEGWKWYETDKLPVEILPGHKAILEMYTNTNASKVQDI